LSTQISNQATTLHGDGNKQLFRGSVRLPSISHAIKLWSGYQIGKSDDDEIIIYKILRCGNRRL